MAGSVEARPAGREDAATDKTKELDTGIISQRVLILRDAHSHPVPKIDIFYGMQFASQFLRALVNR